MANPIKSSDLYKNEGDIRQAIEEVRQFRDELIQLSEEVRGRAASLAKNLKSLNVLSGGGKTQLKQSIDEAGQLLRENQQLQKALSDTNIKLQGLREAKRKANLEAKNAAKLAQAEAGSYNALSAQYSINKTRLNAMGAAKRMLTKEGRDLERQTREIYEEMSRLQKLTGKHTLDVGNYSKATRGLVSNLKSLAGVYLSFEGARRLGDLIFRQTKEIDGLDKAYEKIIPSSIALAQTNEYLSETAEKYGINLLTLRKANLRFEAATRSSNLTADQKRKIFDSIAKSSAALNLEAAKVDRVFNAVEQIMSKGKVSSEELRQQLGDSLPGSLEIMAKALGVSTAELDKMLRKGEVMAEDAMPKFAAQLEKTYGIENVNRIENLASAQGRFETELVKTIEKLKAARPIESFFNLMTKGVKFIGDNIVAIGNLAKGVGIAAAAYVFWRGTLLASRAALALQLPLIARAIQMKGALTVATTLSTRAFQAFNLALRANPIGFIVTGVLLAVTAFEAFGNNVQKTKEEHEGLNVAIKDTNQEITKETTKAKLLFDKLKDVNASTKVRESALRQLKEFYPEYTKELDLEKSTLEDIEKVQNRVTNGIRDRLVEQRKAIELGRIFNKIIDKELQLNEVEDLPLSEFKFIVDQTGADLSPQQFKNNSISRLRDELSKLNEEFDFTEDRFNSLLSGNITPTVGSSGSGGKAGKEYKPIVLESKGDGFDPFEFERLRLQALEDGFEKELALLELSQSERQAKYISAGEFNIDFTEINKQEIFKLIKKYDALELKAIEDRIEKENQLREAQAKEELRRINKRKEIRQKELQERLDEFELSQEILALSFASKNPSAFEQEQFNRTQEKENFEFRLKQAEEFSELFTEKQILLIKAQIQAARKALENLVPPESETKSIWDYLGFNLKDDQEAAFNSAFEFAKNQVQELFALRTQLAQQNLETARQDVALAEARVQAEIDARNQGFANQVEVAKKELALAKENQRKALEDRKNAQKAELQLQTALQASNLISAAAGIWKTVGFPLAIPAIALMFGSFVAAKAKAFQLVKEQRKEGGLDIVGGGSHASGKDTYLGYSINGKPVYAEKGEAHMVLKPQPTKKYRKILPDIFKALNTGTFDQYLQNSLSVHPQVSNNYIPNDNRVMEGHLSELVRTNKQILSKDDEQIFYSNGQKIVKYKNLTRKYVS